MRGLEESTHWNVVVALILDTCCIGLFLGESSAFLSHLNYSWSVLSHLPHRQTLNSLRHFKRWFTHLLVIKGLLLPLWIDPKETIGMNYLCDFLFVDFALDFLGLCEWEVRWWAVWFIWKARVLDCFFIVDFETVIHRTC